MPFAAALSEHPVPAYATGEVCGQVLEALGRGAHEELAGRERWIDAFKTIQAYLKCHCDCHPWSPASSPV